MLSCHTSQQYFKDIAIVFPSQSAVDATVFGIRSSVSWHDVEKEMEARPVPEMTWRMMKALFSPAPI